jgi:hypothetical protein
MIRRFKRIRTPPLCGEYLSWVLYISLEGGGGDGIRYCYRWYSILEFLGDPSLGK